MSERMRPEKKVNTPGGMLDRLKNQILRKLGIDPSRLVLIIERYAVKINGGVRNSDSHSTRTNMLKAFSRGELTIYIFFRFLAALELAGVKIDVTITTKDGREYTVSEEVTFRSGDNVINKKEDSHEEKEK